MLQPRERRDPQEITDRHFAWKAKVEGMTLTQREEELLRMLRKRQGFHREGIEFNELYPPLQEAFISLANKGRITISATLPSNPAEYE